MTKKAVHTALNRSRILFSFAVCLTLLICFVYFAFSYFEQREANLEYGAALKREREIKTLLGFLGRYEAEIEFVRGKSKNFPSHNEVCLDNYMASIVTVLINNNLGNAFYSVYKKEPNGSYKHSYSGGEIFFDRLPHELQQGDLSKIAVFENLHTDGVNISSLVLRSMDGGRLAVAAGFKAARGDLHSEPAAEYRLLFLETLGFSAAMFIFLIVAVFAAVGAYRRSIAAAIKGIYDGAVRKHEQLRLEAVRLNKERADAAVMLSKLAAERKALEEIIKERITDLREIGVHLRKENEKMSAVNQELLHARKRAVEASMVKTEFLANMSHEVRTPIHGILSYSSFGLKKFEHGKDVRQKYYFDKITGSADRLLMFISDLVDISDLESGRLTYKMTECSLKEILESALGNLERFAREKSIAVSLPAEDVKIYGDFVRIKQVFQNIYSNALKFSPENGVIETDIIIKEGFAVISIIDCGTGVDESEKQLIFEKFTQSARTKTGAGGIGLGLAICREIVAGHGGKIYVRDNPAGTGSRFTVELPAC